MVFRTIFVFVILLTASCTFSNAQDTDSLLLSQVDADLSFEDSLSIFHLIDGLLQQGDLEGSQLALRLSYNSNVMSTGRTLGIENFGLSPGISYYHKSGLYADISGYWSKDFDPAYYLTVTTLGYMRDLSKRFSIIASYDHYFYVAGESNYLPYSNSLSITPALELKPFVVSTTYSFYFGDANAHRILPGINILMEKKKLFGLERITLTPSFYVLFGNETITELEFIFPKTVAEGIQNFRKYGSWIRQEQTHKNVFGVMNYAVTLPLSVAHKNWLFSFSYAYHIPRALPGEPLTVSESSYLSGSITRFLRVKRHKLAL